MIGINKGPFKNYVIFGHSKQLSLNKFFDPTTPSMRKGRDGGTGKKKRGEKKKRRMKIVATTSLPAVDHPNADRWIAACSRQKRTYNKKKKEEEFICSL